MQLLIFVFTIFCCYYSTSITYCCISMCKLPCTKKYKLQCRVHFGYRTFKNSTWMQRMQFILTQLFLTPSMHPEQKITSVVKKGHTLLTINILFCGNMSVCFFEFCWWVPLLLPSLILLFRFIYVPSKCQEVLDCSGTSLIISQLTLDVRILCHIQQIITFCNLATWPIIHHVICFQWPAF